MKNDKNYLQRALRLLAVYSACSSGSITEEQAKIILSGELSPGKPETKVDDSQYFRESYTDEEIRKILNTFKAGHV